MQRLFKFYKVCLVNNATLHPVSLELDKFAHVGHLNHRASIYDADIFKGPIKHLS